MRLGLEHHVESRGGDDPLRRLPRQAEHEAEHDRVHEDPEPVQLQPRDVLEWTVAAQVARIRESGILGRSHGLARQAPTVLNSAWVDVHFWDGRAASLEEQATALRLEVTTANRAAGSVDSTVNAFDAQEIGRVMAQRLSPKYYAGNGGSLPSPLPTDFSTFDRNGELHIFGVAREITETASTHASMNAPMKIAGRDKDENIGDPEVLVAIANALGLAGDDLRTRLEGHAQQFAGDRRGDPAGFRRGQRLYPGGCLA